MCAFGLAMVPGASVRTAAVAAPAPAVCPANPVVTTTADSGPGSLRQAIADACADETNPLSPVPDTVSFAMPGAGPHTIVLTSGALQIDTSLVLAPPPGVTIRISGNHASRVFDITARFVSISGLTIMDGSAADGAGIRSAADTMSLFNLTLSGNVATGNGGAIELTSPTSYAEFANATISGNTAADGSAIWTAGRVGVNFSTLTANTGGGATVVTAGDSAAGNSIITGNDGIAVATIGIGSFVDGSGNLLAGDPKLGPLQDNGGPTFTHMPLPGSPAIDAGNMLTLYGDGDQRGLLRVADGPDANTTQTIDIGAVEVVPAVGFIPAQTANENAGVPVSVPFRLGNLGFIPFDSIVATSSNPAVVADANLAISGSGDSRTLTITLDPNHHGITTITVAATAQIPNYDTDTTGPVTGTSSFLLTVAARTMLTGADAGGGPHVRRFTASDGSAPVSGALDSFFGFDPAFPGGVRVAAGDINGDGQPEQIVAAGPGGGPHVIAYDGATGGVVMSFFAFEGSFTGGVFVAAGDVNGDGCADVIAASGAGRRGEIRVFSGLDGSLLRDFFVFSPTFTGGVHVAAGDVNGDGRADLVAGTGAGAAAEVQVLNGNDGSTLRAFQPYGPFPGGVFVAAGDVTGDGFADIVMGAGAGGGPHVMAIDGVTGAVTLSFFAFEGGFAGGVRVAAGDVTGDGRADLIVGSGPGRTATVRVFDGATVALLSETAPYSTFQAGLFVATAVPINRMAVNPPAPGAVISGPFTVAGWGFVDSPSTSGIAAIHVWAVPVAGGAPTFLGLATHGYWRPDVAAIYGAQYDHSGFHLEAPALPPGVYDIAVFAQSSLTGTFPIIRVTRVTVTP